MINKKKYERLPFDQFSRQLQVAEILDVLRKGKQSFKILDVGGYKGATTQVQNSDSVTILDVFDVNEKNYIKGDGLKLPFDDNSFDFVLSFDVLEHIPAKDRRLFIKESARVASRGLVTAAPVSTAANQFAEEKLNGLFRALHGKDHRWLKEHIEYGLPTFGLVENAMSNSKLNIVTLFSNDTILWTLMQSAIFITSKYTNAGQALEDLNITYNRLGPFDSSNIPEENYRHISLGFQNKGDVDTIKKWIKNNVTTSDPVKRARMAESIAKFFNTAITDYATHAERLQASNVQASAEMNRLITINKALSQEIGLIKRSKKYRLVENVAKLKKGLAK